MADPSTDSRLQTFFERVGIIVTTVVVFLLLAEGITRIVDAIANDVPFFGTDRAGELWAEHPFLYRVPRAGSRFQKFDINTHGFRGREFEVPKPDRVFRILALGGSAVWDPDVSSNDATWVAQLEDLLGQNRPPGSQRIEVVNGGVGGYNSAESFMNFVWRGIPIQPDAVIVYHGYNDFKPNRVPGFRPDYSHFRGRDHTMMRALSRSSRFINHFGRLVGKLAPRSMTAHDTVAEPGIRAFQDNLRRIVLLARDRGVQPLLTTYAMSISPENHEQHPDKFSGLARYLTTLSFAGVLDAHQRYNGAVRELAQELKVPLADIDAAVPRDFEHFNDHCHFTDKGAQRVAQAFRDVIVTALDIDSREREAAPQGVPDGQRGDAESARPAEPTP